MRGIPVTLEAIGAKKPWVRCAYRENYRMVKGCIGHGRNRQEDF